MISLIGLTLPHLCVYPWISKVNDVRLIFMEWLANQYCLSFVFITIHGMVDQPVLFNLLFLELTLRADFNIIIP